MCKIYAITPDKSPNFSRIEKLLQSEIYFLQYRRKNTNINTKLTEATTLQKLCKKYKTKFIINDDVNLAIKINADGVHLGQSDLNIKTARKMLGNNKIIGITCHNNISLAIEAQKNSANYVAFGRVFESKTKPNATKCSLKIITLAKQQLNIPIVAIGGITPHNQQLVFDAGCDIVARTI
ncbi:Thiamin-phosphate pyrophosphorylase [hydrothermal vent metagenome]|uniref:thiamine phosphate synthase n=1 Tax=hydrothermal vent metagenome TaxID=652676 RepID=A0A1W1CHU7_9ZZZZ